MPEMLEFYLGRQADSPDIVPNFNDLQDDMEPIDALRPGSDHHAFVLNYLLDRVKSSEDAMSVFYNRWQVAERKLQAYMSLPNYEQMLKDMNDKSKTPAPAIILLPYSYAVIAAAVTYFMKVICARKPFFPLGAASKEAADNVRYMEAMTQHQLDQAKSIVRIHQSLLDGEVYGMSATRLLWREKFSKRRVLRAPTDAERLAFASQPEALPGVLKDYEMRKVFAGTEPCNIDPFMFFPDPNVPIAEVAEKGEFCFWREFLGKHILILAQAEGQLKYVETVNPYQGSNHESKWYNLSHRSAISKGQSHAGESLRKQSQYGISNTYMVDQGTCRIIPKELGLGDGEIPELWLFTILNKSQIVQAQPLDYDHDCHPIATSEPCTMGYGFGQPATSDYTGPIQDISSWFLDSHIYNVRSSLVNQWLYDPSKIDEQSLKNPQPGKHIRMKPAAYGTDARTAITQFPVTDVTRTHMSDLSTFIRIGDMVTSVNDNMRGQPMQGGRRTATESRQMGESSFSRLSVRAQLISQQKFVPMAQQMVLNIQQMQDEEAWVRLIGQEEFQKVGPALLMGDFTYTVHDGTLPLDRVASFDLWKEILMGVAQSPVLSRTHSLPRIFEHVAGLGGAANIATFRLVPDAQMDQIAQAGNAVPLGGEEGPNVPV